MTASDRPSDTEDADAEPSTTWIGDRSELYRIVREGNEALRALTQTQGHPASPAPYTDPNDHWQTKPVESIGAKVGHAWVSAGSHEGEIPPDEPSEEAALLRMILDELQGLRDDCAGMVGYINRNKEPRT